MKPTFGRYFARIIRAVIVSSLGFGGGIGLLTFIAILVLTGKQTALAIAVQVGVVLGIGFGVFYALLLLLSDLTWRLYAAGGLHRDEIWELEQTRVVELPGSLKEVRALSRKALLAVPNIKAVADEEDAYQIRGSVGPSWKSPGENLRIDISPGADDTTWNVRCTSSCLASHIAFDYGKNFENVEAWLRSLKTLQEQEAATSQT